MDKNDLLGYLKNTGGMYVALLKDRSYVSNLAVGIYCDYEPKLIMDEYEDRELKLNQYNLNRCCVPDHEYIHIENLAKIVEKRQRRKSRSIL